MHVKIPGAGEGHKLMRKAVRGSLAFRSRRRLSRPGTSALALGRSNGALSARSVSCVRLAGLFVDAETSHTSEYPEEGCKIKFLHLDLEWGGQPERVRAAGWPLDEGVRTGKVCTAPLRHPALHNPTPLAYLWGSLCTRCLSRSRSWCGRVLSVAEIKALEDVALLLVAAVLWLDAAAGQQSVPLNAGHPYVVRRYRADLVPSPLTGPESRSRWGHHTRGSAHTSGAAACFTLSATTMSTCLCRS
jgi:hypothetical protein